MNDYFKRLYNHPCLELAFFLGCLQTGAVILNKSFTFKQHWVFLPIFFVFPWMIIVLLTSIKGEKR